MFWSTVIRDNKSSSPQKDAHINFLTAGNMFSLVSSTKKTDRHNIAEILLKVALNTTILTL
jgi:hypothetical protein